MAWEKRKTFRERMLEGAANSLSDAGASRYRRLAEEGLPSPEELREMSGSSLSPSERQFYEGIYGRYYPKR